MRQLLINLGYVGGFRFDKFNFVKQSKHTTFDRFMQNHTTFRRSFSKKVLETILLPGPLSFTQFENTYPYQKNVLIRRPRTSALFCCHTAPFCRVNVFPHPSLPRRSLCREIPAGRILTLMRRVCKFCFIFSVLLRVFVSRQKCRLLSSPVIPPWTTFKNTKE